MNILITLSCCFLTLLLQIANAEEANKYTLSECWQIVLTENPELKVLEERCREATLSMKATRSEMFPHVDLDGLYLRHDERLQTRIPAGALSTDPLNLYVGKEYSFNVQALFRQPLTPLFPLYHQYKAEKLRVEIKELEIAAYRVHLAYQTGLAFMDLIKAQKESEIYYNSPEAMLWLFDIKKDNTGFSDKHKSFILEQKHLEIQYNKAIGRKETSTRTLNFLMNREVDTELQIKLKDTPPDFMDLNECLKAAVNNRLELKILDTESKIARQDKRAGYAAFMPQVEALIAYEYLEEPLLEDKEHISLGAGLRWNLWRSGGNKHRLDVARSQEKQAIMRYHLAKQKVIAEVKQCYQAFEQARVRLQLAKETRNEGKTHIEQIAKEIGENVTSEKLLEMLKLYVQFMLDFEEARYDYGISRLQLIRAVGSTSVEAL